MAVTAGTDAARVLVDAAKVHDIVRNLVENAVNYTQADGAIDVGAAVTDGHLLIEVSDNGPGIPAEDLAACLRTVLSRGQVPRPARRHGPWPRDRQAPGELHGGSVAVANRARRRGLASRFACAVERVRRQRELSLG